MIRIEKAVSKGTGVFAAKDFREGETVITGTIEKELSTNDSHACQLGQDRFALLKEPFCFTNHSCNPNCGIRENAAGAHDLIAKKPIAEKEEITFDYAMQNYTVGHFASQCECGAEQCRGKITGWKDLPVDKKEEYHPWAASYLFELDKR